MVELAAGADVLVHEVMLPSALEPLIASEPNAKTLVLSHFVPGGYPLLPDSTWYDAVRPHFSGKIIVGQDLLEL